MDLDEDLLHEILQFRTTARHAMDELGYGSAMLVKELGEGSAVPLPTTRDEVLGVAHER